MTLSMRSWLCVWPQEVVRLRCRSCWTPCSMCYHQSAQGSPSLWWKTITRVACGRRFSVGPVPNAYSSMVCSRSWASLSPATRLYNWPLMLVRTTSHSSMTMNCLPATGWLPCGTKPAVVATTLLVAPWSLCWSSLPDRGSGCSCGMACGCRKKNRAGRLFRAVRRGERMPCSFPPATGWSAVHFFGSTDWILTSPWGSLEGLT